jgi:cellulose biosynthesis protein BcsQ
MHETSPGKIITFYSYKGGAGRSMILANVAWILASNGKRVLTIDWDLEAPGLHRYFHPFLEDKELLTSDGLIDFIMNFTLAAMTPGETSKDWYIQHANILRYASSLHWEFPEPGTLDFVPAGRQGPTYAVRVNTFNWQNFYERFEGGTFLEAAKERMRSEYDYILIDSRTGVSDVSYICTIQMPNTLVICLTLNHQSIKGAAAMAASVRAQRGSAAEPLSAVRIFPVPMRVERAEKQWLDSTRETVRQEFDPFLWHLAHPDRQAYWDQMEFPYVPYYAYSEILATFADSPAAPYSLLAAAERLTAYLTDGAVSRLVPMPEAERGAILGQYHLYR